MMWEKIKKIIEREGGKGIIIEDGQPVYLVERLDEVEEDMEKINRDIENLKASADRDDKIIEPEDEVSKEVRIEDLPF